MKKKNKSVRITQDLDNEDFGTICICALRYSMGRETYMPSLVRDFVRPLLPKLTYSTIVVMLRDCDEQRRYDCYGHEKIDKPGWLEWERELQAEKARRDNGEENNAAK